MRQMSVCKLGRGHVIRQTTFDDHVITGSVASNVCMNLASSHSCFSDKNSALLMTEYDVKIVG